MSLLSRRACFTVFLAFASAYFLSALIRAITATLAPTLTLEFQMSAGDLGLLAGGYFLGFSAMQLPLGTWLDRYGPKRVILCFLATAVLGCVAFSMAGSFATLLTARILCGVGVSACLMAPMTGFRRWMSAPDQLRFTSWMLMSGSLGMLASTLPVQWLVPTHGWRPLFWGLALLVLLSAAVIAWKVPGWDLQRSRAAQHANPSAPGYAQVWANAYFRRLSPLGFFAYGGLVAMQTLWAGPWMIRVTGFSPLQAATGLFWINLTMLFIFWSWGMAMPWLIRRGLDAETLITFGIPTVFVVLAVIILLGDGAGPWIVVLWTLFCACSSVCALLQSSVGLAFPESLAGRALSAYNLVIFAGVFVVQWGIGALVDAGRSSGLSQTASFQLAMSVFLACSVLSYVYYLATKSHNPVRHPA